MTISCPLFCLQPEEYSADELKDAEKVTEAIEAQTGGQLQTYTPSDEDAVHWWVFAVIDLMPSVRMVPEVCEQRAGCYSYPFCLTNSHSAPCRYGHHQHAPSQYELYVFRDALVPDSYSPASLKAKAK